MMQNQERWNLLLDEAEKQVSENPELIYHYKKLYANSQKVLPEKDRYIHIPSSEVLQMVAGLEKRSMEKKKGASEKLPAVNGDHPFAPVLNGALEIIEKQGGRIKALEERMVVMEDRSDHHLRVITSILEWAGKLGKALSTFFSMPVIENKAAFEDLPTVVIVGGPHDLMEDPTWGISGYSDRLKITHIQARGDYLDKVNAVWGKCSYMILFNGATNGLRDFVLSKRKSGTVLWSYKINSPEELHSKLDRASEDVKHPEL